MFESIAIGLGAFLVGFLAQSWIARRRFMAARERSQKQLDALQGQLGQKRLRIQELERELSRSDGP